MVGPRAGSLDRLLALFEAGWRRPGSAPPTTSFSTATAPSPRSPATRSATRARTPSPVWLERNFSFAIGPHQLRGRVDRVDRLPEGGYELIDYKTGDPGGGPELSGDVQLALYRLAAREAWRIEADRGQLLVRARRRASRRRRRARRRRASRANRARGRRRDQRAGLRAAPLARDLLLVRLPPDLPRERGLSRDPARGSARLRLSGPPCWRRKRWKSRAIVSPEGTSSVSRSGLSSCSVSSRRTSSSISGLAATARST